MIQQLLFLAGSGAGITDYDKIIIAAVIILLSYTFDFVAKKFKIPSVILLIVLGTAMAWAADEFLGYKAGTGIIPILNIIGTIGLILIVLEAALDLKLEREKTGIIIRAFIVALFVLLLTVGGVALILYYVLPIITDTQIDFLNALVYATPLSIMSSAIVIPSVGSLGQEKKEFMIYEATFSDILGIILFFFLTGLAPEESVKLAALNEVIRLTLTIVISIVVGYALVYFISGLTKKANFFTIFALLALSYALGKKYHLSSLIIILVFGLILYNEKLFFRGPLSGLISPKKHKRIIEDFKLLTHQSAFLVRTFFFVAFGMIIKLSALGDWHVLAIGGLILLMIYIVRYAQLSVVSDHSIMPELLIAPRGLITVLLFFQIPEQYKLENFNDGVMFVVIIISALIMMFALMFSKSDFKVVESVGGLEDEEALLFGYGRSVNEDE